MASILEDLAGTLGGDTLGQLAGVLGADSEAVSRGVAAALPALVGGLASNTRRQAGATSLSNTLDDRHDGSILDSLGTIFGGSQWALEQATRDGDGILGHVFGQSQSRVEQQVQAASGLSMSTVRQLLPLLAPVVLGYLGKRLRGGGADEVASTLEQERVEVKKYDGTFGRILDILDGDDDGDGGGGSLMDMAGELLQGPAGRSILGQLLGR